MCFPTSPADVAAAVATAARHGRPFVARGSGTGLAGGATPVGRPVVIVTTHLNQILDVDPSAHYAHYALGQSLKRLGRRTEAGTHLRLAVALSPQTALYRDALARLGPAARAPGGDPG